MTQQNKKTEAATPKSVEPEHTGPIWKHPYFAYILLTVVLFLFLILAASLALQNDWLPKR